MSEDRTSRLMADMVGRGGVTSQYHGATVVRHFGNPAAEYAAATGATAVFDRGHRARLAVAGRAPLQMLSGILTGVMPVGPRELEPGLVAGSATYHAVLTPKGKMITDLWAWLPGHEADPGVLLDVAAAGVEALRSQLLRSIPPRMARVADVSGQTGMITLVGPGAASWVARIVLAGRVEPSTLTDAEEGAWWRVGSVSSPTVLRTQEVWPEALSVVGPDADVGALWRRALDEGVTPAGLGVWSTLRVEAGRPAFGTDMDEDTIPVEAGIQDRAIDPRKGCYTGQEVIVRIRDRGHVNRHLRSLVLGDVPTPAAGTELLAADGSGKVVGRITSAVQSPRAGGVLALAYVRRGVDTVSLDGHEIPVPQ